MSYEQFYGLKEPPFSSAPDSRFYFDSNQHSEAMIRIMHAIDTMKGLSVMLGDIGTGKTLLARRILEKLNPEKYEVVLLVIVHSELSAPWLLKRIAQQIGVKEPSEDKVSLLTQIYNRLVEIYEEGRKTVLIVDEANMLRTKEIMEEFRGLLNLEVPGSKLISIILIGLPELNDNLASDEPLRQRVELKFTLKPLSLESTIDYIKFRLSVAEANRDLFTEEAMRLTYSYSKGIPRIINVICDNALLEGYITKKEKIEAPLIEEVATNLGLKMD